MEENAENTWCFHLNELFNCVQDHACSCYSFQLQQILWFYSMIKVLTDQFSSSINHPVTMRVMTDGPCTWKSKEIQQRVNFTESESSNLPHPLYMWTPLDSTSLWSASRERLHAGCLMERRRACEVRWPVRIAPTRSCSRIGRLITCNAQPHTNQEWQLKG